MDFGYFTLSDNRYPNNTRTAEQFIQNIYDEALYADTIGMHSAWIGEHHFNLLGCNSSPHMLCAQIAGATKNIRLAPGVVLLPVHHPLQVAEEWATLDLLSGGRVDFSAGRGYDRKEFEPFEKPFMESAELFTEGLEIIWKAWTEEGRWSYKGQYYNFEDIEIRPRPAQKPLRPYIACFSKFSMELAAKNDWNIIFAPFAATMVYGGLAQGVQTFGEECNKFGYERRKTKCSYFIHIADNEQEVSYGQTALVRYFKDALLAAFPSDIKKMPPTMTYFLEIVSILKDMRPEKLSSNSILVGSPDKITEDLKRVEQAGIDEVILYFNYGLKDHQMVLEQMDRFMKEIAPNF